MKQRISGLLTAVILLLVMVCPAFAAAEDVPYSTMVADNAGLLDAQQVQELDTRAWTITHTYECAVYIVTTDDLEGMETQEYAEALHAQNGMGYGSDQSCVILLLSTENREYNLMACGYGSTAFTEYGKQALAETFLDEFADDDWYGGFAAYLDGCEEYLQLARDGSPVDQGRSPLLGILLGVVVPLLISLLICSCFKAQMKTAKPQKAAKVYIDRDGLVLTGKTDQFMHTTRTERYIEPDRSSSDANGGSSHSGGSF